MATKTATIVLSGGPMRFEANLGSGHHLVLDDSEGDTGVRPAELVPLALAACTAMDVISILRKKRQDVTRYAVEAEGEQMEEHPHAFTRIVVTHVVEGPAIDVAAVRRSIELSATKYCSVGSTISSGVTVVHHRYRIVDATGREESDEVLVTGPNEPPAVLAARATG